MDAQYLQMDQPTTRRRLWSPSAVVGTMATCAGLALVCIVTVQPKHFFGATRLDSTTMHSKCMSNKDCDNMTLCYEVIKEYYFEDSDHGCDEYADNYVGGCYCKEKYYKEKVAEEKNNTAYYKDKFAKEKNKTDYYKEEVAEEKNNTDYFKDKFAKEKNKTAHHMATTTTTTTATATTTEGIAHWMVGDYQESCDSVCGPHGGCMQSSLDGLWSAERLMAVHWPFSPEFAKGCQAAMEDNYQNQNPGDPSLQGDRFCFFSTSKSTCGARNTAYLSLQRICPCRSP